MFNEIAFDELRLFFIFERKNIKFKIRVSYSLLKLIFKMFYDIHNCFNGFYVIS